MDSIPTHRSKPKSDIQLSPKDGWIVFPLPTVIGSRAFALASATTTVAAILGGIAGLRFFMSSGVPHTRPILAALEIFDPLALQTLAFVHCFGCLIAWNFQQRSEVSARWKSVLKSTVMLSILFALYYVINDFVFKKSFGRPRPAAEIQVGVGFVTQYFRSANEGAPSGFAGRGVFLVLTAAMAGLGSGRLRGWRNVFSDLKVILAIQSSLLVLTCSARVLSGSHFWFDVLLGLSLAVFVYWILLFLLSTFAGRFRLEDMEPLSSLLVSAVIWFTIIGFFYSKDASRWAPSVAVIMLAFLVVQIRVSRQLRPSGPTRDELENSDEVD